MGYDMHTVIKPEGEERAVARINEQIEAAVKERNTFEHSSLEYQAAQAEVGRLYEQRYAAERSYFRVNIFGMRYFRDAMLLSGMAYESNADEAGPWLAYPDNDEVEKAYEALQWPQYESEPIERFSQEARDAAALYKRERDEKLSFHPVGGSTIPLHKFGSNDGWIVTPAEIQGALAAWRSLSSGERDDALIGAEMIGADWDRRWKQWLQFLELATHCNGLEVH